jgi:dipeptidase E
MPVILTSNGLTSNSVMSLFASQRRDDFQNAAVIVTADPEYRERNWKAIATKADLESMGYRAAFFDIELTPSNLLYGYDVLFFIGGNPFYLLDQLRKTRTSDVLHTLLKQGRVISGASAGSIVMGRTIALMNEFDPQLNSGIQLNDLSGIGLTSVNLCPHYSKFASSYENFEERIRYVEKANGIMITRINDGEAIVIDHNNVTKI